MPGARNTSGGFVTRRTVYRENIVAVDAAGPEDPSIPILDTRTVAVGPSNPENNNHGGDARIFAAVMLCNIDFATIQIWLKAEVEPFGSSSSFSSSSYNSSSLDVECSDWVLVNEFDVTVSYLVRQTDIPPGKYKILVSALTGAGSIELRTQYAG